MENNQWLNKLSESQKYVYDKVILNHDIYSKKDKRLKKTTNIFKILTLLFASLTTLILGLKFDWIESTVKQNIALILGALITFISGISNFWNIERYWMRNVTMHIELNKLRDEFEYYVKFATAIEDDIIQGFFKQLSKLNDENINYWKNIMK